MIKNNPNTGLAVMLREVSPGGIINSSPSIFQKNKLPHSGSNPNIIQSQYRRDSLPLPMSYQDTALTTLSQGNNNAASDYQTMQFQSPPTAI